MAKWYCLSVFFFQAEDGIRDGHVTGVQTCALPIWAGSPSSAIPEIAVSEPKQGRGGGRTADRRSVAPRPCRPCRPAPPRDSRRRPSGSAWSAREVRGHSYDAVQDGSPEGLEDRGARRSRARHAEDGEPCRFDVAVPVEGEVAEDAVPDLGPSQLLEDRLARPV